MHALLGVPCEVHLNRPWFLKETIRRREEGRGGEGRRGEEGGGEGRGEERREEPYGASLVATGVLGGDNELVATACLLEPLS